MFQLTRKLNRRSIAESTVRTCMIVVVSIRIDRFARFFHGAPPMQIEQLVSHPTIVALDDCRFSEPWDPRKNGIEALPSWTLPERLRTRITCPVCAR